MGMASFINIGVSSADMSSLKTIKKCFKKSIIIL